MQNTTKFFILLSFIFVSINVITKSARSIVEQSFYAASNNKVVKALSNNLLKKEVKHLYRSDSKWESAADYIEYGSLNCFVVNKVINLKSKRVTSFNSLKQNFLISDLISLSEFMWVTATGRFSSFLKDKDETICNSVKLNSLRVSLQECLSLHVSLVNSFYYASASLALKIILLKEYFNLYPEYLEQTHGLNIQETLDNLKNAEQLLSNVFVIIYPPMGLVGTEIDFKRMIPRCKDTDALACFALSEFKQLANQENATIEVYFESFGENSKLLSSVNELFALCFSVSA